MTWFNKIYNSLQELADEITEENRKDPKYLEMKKESTKELKRIHRELEPNISGVIEGFYGTMIRQK